MLAHLELSGQIPPPPQASKMVVEVLDKTLGSTKEYPMVGGPKESFCEREKAHYGDISRGP